ncbi:bifunctional nicotinamide-nucleotide adenylyltransferase/Nudix hydroxylase [Aquabacterium humicola]|uniref:bifunctional nicotinamide-nucleotide adenylyltransferase/Nudix hydroxylase n=1 Tax=Aquabacterium humicola TaxID=3237377 RepID=UPI002543F7DB|nr:bifunctional nicotinamide-nucleotide adenylyltransferase/Nudix hydroxylase [Rubrivivax pictus]
MTTGQHHDAAVFIGRFQPFHSGHAALLRAALDAAPLCVVVIGSAFQARTPKNPFSWQERAEMFRLALPEEQRERLRFLPVRDYYNEERWTQRVRTGVHALLALAGIENPRVTLVGHFKDATSDYLRAFPGWTLHSIDRSGPVDATGLRDAYFGCAGENLDATLAALVDQAPPSTLAMLRAWAALPQYRLLTAEWRFIQAYREAWSQVPYPPVFVTVDALVRCGAEVLLIRRGEAPGKGLYALPGGFIDPRETAWQSALRELKEETKLSLLDGSMRMALKANVVFDHPDRSQRGRTITHAFYFDLGERERPEVLAGDDAARVEWVPIERLAGLEDQFHDDHFHMLDHFLGLTDG